MPHGSSATACFPRPGTSVTGLTILTPAARSVAHRRVEIREREADVVDRAARAGTCVVRERNRSWMGSGWSPGHVPQATASGVSPALPPMCWMYQSRACSTSGTARCRWSNGSMTCACACAGEHNASTIAHAAAVFRGLREGPFERLRPGCMPVTVCHPAGVRFTRRLNLRVTRARCAPAAKEARALRRNAERSRSRWARVRFPRPSP